MTCSLPDAVMHTPCMYMYIHVRKTDCLGCAVLLYLVVCLALLAAVNNYHDTIQDVPQVI